MKRLGPPCGRCGSTEKYGNRMCVPCARERARRARAADPEKAREAVRAHRFRRKAQEDPEAALVILERTAREHRALHPTTADHIRRLRDLAAQFIRPFTPPEKGGLVDMLLWAADKIEQAEKGEGE